MLSGIPCDFRGQVRSLLPSLVQVLPQALEPRSELLVLGRQGVPLVSTLFDLLGYLKQLVVHLLGSLEQGLVLV